MKKLLLIFGIILIIAGVLALLFAALSRFGYYNLLDRIAQRSLPHRQLRKTEFKPRTEIACSLPHRQLRNITKTGMPIFIAFTAA